MSYNTGAEPYSYIVSTNGTVVSALNTTTGRVEFSGTDAGPVFRSVFTALAALKTGAVYVKKGVYNIDSFAVATGGSYTPYYAIQIPTAQSTVTTDMEVYKLIGESSWGTVINITATAIATRSSGDKIIGIWQQYSPSMPSPTFTDTEISGLTVQVPDNQRGNEHLIDLRYGSRVRVSDVFLYGSNIATGGSIPTVSAVAGTDGMVGLRMPNNLTVTTCILSKVNIVGCYEAFILPELTVGQNLECGLNTYGIVLGPTGSGNLFHPVTLQNVIDSNTNGLVVGPTVQAGALLNITGYGIEYFVSENAWDRVSEAVENTPGTMSGTISYTQIRSGVGIQNKAFWESGSGTKFLTQQSQDATWKLGASTVPTMGGDPLTTNASALTSDLPVIGAGTHKVAVGTRSGNTTKYVTATGTLTSTHLGVWDANGNLIDGGAPGSASLDVGSSPITSGTSGRLLYEDGSNNLGELILGTNLSISGGNTLDAATGGSAGPTFSATKSSNQTALTSGAEATVTWDTEEWDTNSNFASNTFTPTVSGKYLITAHAICTPTSGGSLVASNDNYIAIVKNSTTFSLTVATATISQVELYDSVIVDMNGSTDAIHIVVLVTTVSGTFVVNSGAYTRFQGIKVG